MKASRAALETVCCGCDLRLQNAAIDSLYRTKSVEKISYGIVLEETACYVNDMEIGGFVHACKEHYLRDKEGIVGKAFISNQPFFSSDVKAYDIGEYLLVQHARRYGLNAAVAIKLRSTYTGELLLPVNMKESLEQLLLDSLSGTMQRICRTLRTVSEVGSTKKEVTKPGFRSGDMSNSPQTTCSGNFQTISLDDPEFNSARSIFSVMSSDKENGVTISQGTLEHDISKALTPEKKKSTSEKNKLKRSPTTFFWES